MCLEPQLAVLLESGAGQELPVAAGVPAGLAGPKCGPVCPAESVCIAMSPTVHSRDICFLAAGFDILLLFASGRTGECVDPHEFCISDLSPLSSYLKSLRMGKRKPDCQQHWKTLHITLWFIISQVLLSKITRGHNGCRNMETTTGWPQLTVVYTGMDQQGSGNMGFQQACGCQMDKSLGTPHMDVPGQCLFLWWIFACMDCVNRG